MQRTFVKADTLKQKPTDETKLGFGRIFTDYMFTMRYSGDKGWIDAKIEPYAPFQMDPSTMVLHYGQGIFEGLKAYTGKDGYYLFRPEDNFKRMNASARRLCMPEVDIPFVIDSLKELVTLEKDWIPKSKGTSLYIRPTMIAVDPFVGVSASTEYLFYIILSPVGAYYAEGFQPVKIYVEENYVRASDGGLGEAKTMANYAASLYAGEVAHKKGFSQVLWLDAAEKKYIQEVGSMNIFFQIDGELLTPPLEGMILPGITRNSVLQLAKEMGVKASERSFSIDDVITAQKNGKLNEAFGTGTAAVISPVGLLQYKGVDYVVNDNKIGPLAQKMYDRLTGIQYGEEAESYGWSIKL
ncbi:branched-chain amino acid aminotransferase [Clostridia bacterium OttesenSCG-928-F22]|nr:branched-chain amino acid aminotransferase [Clostridia bacterium OttesenSCG-928-F22]